MSSPGLLLILPLASAAIGALIGAFANEFLRNRGERRKVAQKRNGLLVLLGAELGGNQYTLSSKLEIPAITAVRLSDRVWHDTKSEIALLVPASDLWHLTQHYAFVRNIKEAWIGIEEQPTDTQLYVTSQLEVEARRLHGRIRTLVDDPDSLPLIAHGVD